MSSFVTLVGARPEHLPGLVEELAEWGGEAPSHDPPRYRYDVLHWTLVPLAPDVAAALPRPLDAERTCLDLEQRVVLDWARDDLDERDREALRRMFLALRTGGTWACVCDPSHGASITTIPCGPEDLLENVGRTLARAEAQGVVVFVVSPRTSMQGR